MKTPLKTTLTRLNRFSIGLSVLFLSGYAHALDHTNDFESLYSQLFDWASGTLGRSIALVFLLVGLGIGAIRGSIMGAVVCIASALALVVAPAVVDSIFNVTAG